MTVGGLRLLQDLLQSLLNPLRQIRPRNPTDAAAGDAPKLTDRASAYLTHEGEPRPSVYGLPAAPRSTTPSASAMSAGDVAARHLMAEHQLQQSQQSKQERQSAQSIQALRFRRLVGGGAAASRAG